jgi:hypothetical protein
MPKLQEKPSALKRELLKMKILSFFYFLGHFCPPGSGSGSAICMRIRIQQLKLMRIRIRIRIRIRNPASGAWIFRSKNNHTPCKFKVNLLIIFSRHLFYVNVRSNIFLAVFFRSNFFICWTKVGN